MFFLSVFIWYPILTFWTCLTALFSDRLLSEASLNGDEVRNKPRPLPSWGEIKLAMVSHNHGNGWAVRVKWCLVDKDKTQVLVLLFLKKKMKEKMYRLTHCLPLEGWGGDVTDGGEEELRPGKIYGCSYGGHGHGHGHGWSKSRDQVNWRQMMRYGDPCREKLKNVFVVVFMTGHTDCPSEILTGFLWRNKKR